jgi:hypothetical protein
MSDEVSIQCEMALSREIEKHLDRLIRAAGEKALLLREDNTMRESQIRNVLDVALYHAQSQMAVANFILYQVGRSGGNRAWLHKSFGEQVVKDIQSAEGIVCLIAKDVAKAVCDEVQEARRDEVARRATLRLMRLYLGYLNRWFFYGEKTRQWNTLESLLKEECNVR